MDWTMGMTYRQRAKETGYARLALQCQRATSTRAERIPKGEGDKRAPWWWHRKTNSAGGYSSSERTSKPRPADPSLIPTDLPLQSTFVRLASTNASFLVVFGLSDGAQGQRDTTGLQGSACGNRRLLAASGGGGDSIHGSLSARNYTGLRFQWPSVLVAARRRQALLPLGPALLVVMIIV